MKYSNYSKIINRIRKKPFRIHCFIAIIYVLSLTTQCFGQTYFFEYIKKVNYNLASDKVYAILINTDQKIWLGTDIGLSIFDGKDIRNYSKKDGLADNGVNTLYRDSHGFIWLGHRKGGISRFDGFKFESRTDKLIFKESDITSFCEDSEGNLWITSVGAGAIKISNPKQKLEDIKYEQYKGNRLSDVVFNCTMLENKKLYFITNASVIKYYNSQKNNFETLEKKGLPNYFQITCMLEDNESNLWIGTYHGGLYKYIKKEDRIQFFDIRDGLASNYISSIFQDRAGDIWVSHYEGGGITRLRNGKIISNFNKDNGLNDYNIYCISEDREGNILIGTRENGLVILKDESFTLYINNEKQFPSVEVFSIITDKDKRYWFGTNDGLVIYDTKAKNDKKFTIIPGNVFGNPKKVRFIKEDLDQNLWIGTIGDGVFMYNIKTKKIETPLLGLPLDNFYDITALEIDKKNNLWIGTKFYLLRYNIKTADLQTFTQGDGLIGSNITAVYIDKNNVKYIGSQEKSGLTIIPNDTVSRNDLKFELGGATPTSITGDTKGNIWIGTQNQGVICFKNGNIVKQYSQADGLLSDVISFVKIFNGSLFVGTGVGMNKIDLNTDNITVYTKRNGLPGIETKQNAVYGDNENTLWIGTISGVVRYAPKLEKKANIEPIPKINYVIVNKDTLDISKVKNLSYSQRSVKLDFSCVSLTNQDAVIFKYILEGSTNSEWQNTTKQQKDYDQLEPGNYKFKVIARNYAGVWSSTPAEFSFRINPPFYRTWWFIWICIIIGLVILFGYIKAREKQLIKEKRVLEEKVKERTQEIVNINRQLEVKNKDITDSIQYASRIQNAILPPDLPFENTFVLFKPKDIVSGDFFWFMAQENSEWFAAVDCTGHGVPGAFMSIIGHNSLNRILQEFNITKPSEILNHLNEEIAATLHHYHKDNQIHDGMDIALASYDKETRTLEYSGAFNPLWLIRKNELIETRANRYAIGLAPGIEKDFTNNEIKIENGDTIYLFSDGYADQFGGPDNRKLKVGYFKEILLGIQHLSMAEQKNHLNDFIEKWRGENVQLDDILVIGRRFEF
jgi:ligand-binding sensor domain-containing protein/serine phosphatase RsbU (regulator of sigma subunit)